MREREEKKKQIFRTLGQNGEKYCLFGRLLYKYREDGHFVTCEVDHPGYTEEERDNKENVIQLELSSGAAKPQWICIRKKNKACLSQEFTANLENSNNSESRIVPVYFPKGDFRPVLLHRHIIWFVKFQNHILVTYYRHSLLSLLMWGHKKRNAEAKTT